MWNLAGLVVVLAAGQIASSVEISSSTSGASAHSLFHFETIQWTDETARRVPSGVRQLLRAHDGVSPVPWADQKCKTYPGDASWPEDGVWRDFGKALEGGLLKPAPAASVCYNHTAFNDYSETDCQDLSQTWSTTYVR